MNKLQQIILCFFPQPTATWLERRLNNQGLLKDIQKQEVFNILQKAKFSESDLQMLWTDVRHSCSHCRFNPTTDNGTNYNKEVYKRYKDLTDWVKDFKENQSM